MRKQKISTFIKGRRGSVATIGAITIGVVVASVALSATVAHTYEVRADMQRALDAALLSAARAGDYEDPEPAVRKYLQSYVRDAQIPAKNMIVQARYDEERGVIVGDVKFRVDAIFPMPTSIDQQMRPRVASQVTPQGDRRLEIALSLDMSGSMDNLLPDGRRRVDGLRSALDELFSLIEVEASDEKNGKILVSVVPYASSVNIGNLYKGVGTASSIQGGSIANLQPEPHAFFSAPKSRAQYLQQYYGLRTNASSGAVDAASDRDLTSAYISRGAWAIERTGSERGLDSSPNVAKMRFATGSEMLALQRARQRITDPRAGSKSWVTPAPHILPMTDKIADLRAFVQNLAPYGGTAGHIGMEWAWYTLSPSWGGVWAIQPTDAQGRFKRVDQILSDGALESLLGGLLGDLGSGVGQLVDGLLGGLLGSGATAAGQSYVEVNKIPVPYETRNAFKVIIAMTDGEFSAPVDPNLGSSSSDSYAHFQRVCAAAAEKGVSIYTIAFSEDAAGLDSLRRCASRNANFFRAQDTAELTTAFRKIFAQVTALHVSR